MQKRCLSSAKEPFSRFVSYMASCCVSEWKKRSVSYNIWTSNQFFDDDTHITRYIVSSLT